MICSILEKRYLKKKVKKQKGLKSLQIVFGCTPVKCCTNCELKKRNNSCKINAEELRKIVNDKGMSQSDKMGCEFYQ